MPRTYKRAKGTRSYANYSPNVIDDAVKSVQEGKLSITKAAKQFGIAKGTLMNRIHGKHGKQVGCPTALKAEEEAILEKRLIQCSSFGFPLTAMDLRIIVKSYLDSIGRTVPFFSMNLPGPDWCEGFMKRHSTLSKRLASNIKRSRASVGENVLRETATPSTSGTHQMSPSEMNSSVDENDVITTMFGQFLHKNRFGGESRGRGRGRGRGAKIVPGKSVTQATFTQQLEAENTLRGGGKNAAKRRLHFSSSCRTARSSSSSTEESEEGGLLISPIKQSVAVPGAPVSKEQTAKEDTSINKVNVNDLVIVQLIYGKTSNKSKRFLAKVEDIGEKEFLVTYYKASANLTTFTLDIEDMSHVLAEDIVAVVKDEYTINSRGQCIFENPLCVSK